MAAFPWTSLSTLLALAVYIGISMNVTRARSRYGVAAPAVAGQPDFERVYRVQVNTVEQIVIMLPALWLCAAWIGDFYAAAGGAVWSLGRIVYARGYYAKAEKRELGFVLTAVPTVLMLLADLGAVVRALI